MMRRLLAAVALALSAGGVVLAQQPARRGGPRPTLGQAPTTIQAEPSGESATLTFSIGRSSCCARACSRAVRRERAAGAARILEGLAGQGVTGPVTRSRSRPGFSIRVGVGSCSGWRRLTSTTCRAKRWRASPAQTVARLQQALTEAHEARRPGVLLRAVALASIALAAGLLALWGISRSRRAAAQRLIDLSEKTAARTGVASAEALRATRVLEVERRFVNAVALLLDALIIYVVVTFVLRRFPYTRPWGESMRGFLIDTVQSLGLSVAHAFPGFFTVALILVLARLFTRLIAAYFNAVETRAARRAAMDASGDGAADAPPAHRGHVAVRHRRGLSVPAGQRDRGVQAASASSSA